MAYLTTNCWFYHKILERHSAQLDILLKAGLAGVGVIEATVLLARETSTSELILPQPPPFPSVALRRLNEHVLLSMTKAK